MGSVAMGPWELLHSASFMSIPQDLLRAMPRASSRRLLLILAAGAALRAQAPPPPPPTPQTPVPQGQGPVPPPSAQVPLDKLAKAVEDIHSKDYAWSVESKPVLRTSVPGQIEV